MYIEVGKLIKIHLLSAFHAQATVLRALYIFTQVILLTIYKIFTNYQALVKYLSQKKILIILSNITKPVSVGISILNPENVALELALLIM